MPVGFSPFSVVDSCKNSLCLFPKPFLLFSVHFAHMCGPSWIQQDLLTTQTCYMLQTASSDLKNAISMSVRLLGH